MAFFLQDELAMLRALYVGSLVADRDHFRSSRPGMNVNDFDRIEDADERMEYQRICKLLANVGILLTTVHCIFKSSMTTRSIAGYEN